MKKYISRIFSITMLGILLVTGTSNKAEAQDINVSYQTFYDNLSPYGQWIYDPEFGNVWVPNEGGDFRPYGSRGRWVMTEYGNTWVSDDPWGWAVYHYGRWTFNPYYGWVWLPGYEWAPAWVSWRFGGGYAGWAPLGPGVNVGASYYAPDSWWIFVGPQNMYSPNCMNYWYGPSYNTRYIRQTTIINNYYVDNSTRVRYNYGPRAEVIQEVTRQPVQVFRVNQLNRPGAPSVGRNSVSLYRPSVNRATVDGSRPNNVMQAPRPVGRGQDASQMSSGRQPAFRQEVQRTQVNSQNGRTDNRNDVRSNPANRYDSRIQDDNGNNRVNQSNGRNDNRYQQNDQTREQAPVDNRNDMRSNQQNYNNNRNDTRQPSTPQPNRYDSRMDNRQQSVPTPQPNRYDSRMDNRQQSVPTPQPNRYDSRMDNRQQSMPTPQPNRYDSRMDNRQQSVPTPQPNRYDSRMDNRQQSQPSRPPSATPAQQPIRQQAQPQPQAPSQSIRSQQPSVPAQNNESRPAGGGRR